MTKAITIFLTEEEQDLLMHTMDYAIDRARDGDATAEQEAMAFAIYDTVKVPVMDRPVDFTPEETRLLFDEMNRALRNIAQNGEILEDEKALCLSILTKVQKHYKNNLTHYDH